MPIMPGKSDFKETMSDMALASGRRMKLGYYDQGGM